MLIMCYHFQARKNKINCNNDSGKASHFYKLQKIYTIEGLGKINRMWIIMKKIDIMITIYKILLFS